MAAKGTVTESVKRMAKCKNEIQVILNDACLLISPLDIKYYITAFQSNYDTDVHYRLARLVELEAAYPNASSVERHESHVITCHVVNKLFGLAIGQEMKRVRATLELSDNVPRAERVGLAQTLIAIFDKMAAKRDGSRYDRQGSGGSGMIREDPYIFNKSFASQVATECMLGRQDKFQTYLARDRGPDKGSFSDSLKGNKADRALMAWEEVDEGMALLKNNMWEDVMKTVRGIKENTEEEKEMRARNAMDRDSEKNGSTGSCPYAGPEITAARLFYECVITQGGYSAFYEKLKTQNTDGVELAKREAIHQQDPTKYPEVAGQRKKHTGRWNTLYTNLKELVTASLKIYVPKMRAITKFTVTTMADSVTIMNNMFGVKVDTNAVQEKYLSPVALTGNRFASIICSLTDKGDAYKVLKHLPIEEIISVISKIQNVERVTYGSDNEVDDSQHILRKLLSGQYANRMSIISNVSFVGTVIGYGQTTSLSFDYMEDGLTNSQMAPAIKGMLDSMLAKDIDADPGTLVTAMSRLTADSKSKGSPSLSISIGMGDLNSTPSIPALANGTSFI